MTTVIKVGGSILEPNPVRELIAALAQQVEAGPVVVVHGGGKTLTALLARLGIASEFRDGLRVTSGEALQAAVMAFAGSVNTALVAALNAAGIRAVGLTGCDAGCVRAVAQAGLGAVGGTASADATLLRSLLASGFTPVLASLALDAAGAGILNVNADQFAAAIAAALGAERLLFLTDVNGVLDTRGQTVPQATLAELRTLAMSGALHGGMLPKTAACVTALEAGVREVSILGPGGAGTQLSL